MQSKKKSAIYLLVISILGCNSQSEKDNAEVEQPPQEAAHVISPIEPNSPSERSVPNVLQEVPKHLLINGIKMQVVEYPLTKGSKLYDYKVSSIGLVRGSLVIITKNLQSVLENTAYPVTSEEIAASTYRITPKQALDVYPLYQALLLNKDISRVELEISYIGDGPSKKREEW